jgi:hypothetical protein
MDGNNKKEGAGEAKRRGRRTVCLGMQGCERGGGERRRRRREREEGE